MWSNWQRTARHVLAMEMTAAVRRCKINVVETAHSMWACVERAVCVCVYDCDCSWYFYFCRYPTMCDDQWTTMRHSKQAFTFFTTQQHKQLHKWLSHESMHDVRKCCFICVCTYFVNVYYTIWSCNLTAIIVKLQNNELNCLYFFTYHT